MKFISLDVETSNYDHSSICQIGIALFDKGQLINTWKTYVNPEDYFEKVHISKHGITESIVIAAPKFPDIYNFLTNYIGNNIVVHHTSYDKISINRAIDKYNLTKIDANWFDSSTLARRTWDDVVHRGYGLQNLADKLGINFKHHDALEDAIATGKVTLKALDLLGITIEEACTYIKKQKKRKYSNREKQDFRRVGNCEGELFGESVVFTGALKIKRQEAADLAKEIGCDVENNVTSKTTILILGSLDPRTLRGKKKSSKLLKAEKLISEGLNLRIISEDDFLELVNQ